MKKTIIILTSLITLVAILNPVYADEDSTLKWEGYVALDADFFSPFLNENNNSLDDDSKYIHESEVRRARITLKYLTDSNWDAKLQFDLSNEGNEIKDGYIRYRAWDYANISLGQQKEPFGLENQSGSRHLLFIERSISSEALAPGRSLGLKFNGEIAKLNWSAGLFSSEDDGDATSLSARAIYQAWHSKNQHWHFGTSFSLRELNGEEFRINQALEVHTADSSIEGDSINANNTRILGFETLWTNKKLILMGEWITESVNGYDEQITLSSADITQRYEGGYMQIAYSPNKSTRKIKNGLLSAPSSLKGAGRWEVSYRISEFSLIDENKNTQTHTLGLNYYINKDIKLMANYLSTVYEDNEKTSTADAISVRLQVSF